MGEIKKPSKVKLFIGMISFNELLCVEAEELLSQKFGKVDFRSQILPFNYTLDCVVDHYLRSLVRQVIEPNLITQTDCDEHTVETVDPFFKLIDLSG